MRTADEILAKWEGHPGLSLNDDKVRTGRMRVVAAMKEFASLYHKEKLKEELHLFRKFYNERYQDFNENHCDTKDQRVADILYCDVNDYLKTTE